MSTPSTYGSRATPPSVPLNRRTRADSHSRRFPLAPLPAQADSRLRQFPLRPLPAQADSHLRRFPLRPIPAQADSHLGRFPLRPIPTCAFSWLSSRTLSRARPTSATSCSRSRSSSAPCAPPPTSAPGLNGLTPCHICTGTRLTAATFARGLGSPLPHLHLDWGSPLPHLRQDRRGEPQFRCRCGRSTAAARSSWCSAKALTC